MHSCAIIVLCLIRRSLGWFDCSNGRPSVSMILSFSSSVRVGSSPVSFSLQQVFHFLLGLFSPLHGYRKLSPCSAAWIIFLGWIGLAWLGLAMSSQCRRCWDCINNTTQCLVVEAWLCREAFRESKVPQFSQSAIRQLNPLLWSFLGRFICCDGSDVPLEREPLTTGLGYV